jgi:hypothetical protein
LVSGRDSTLEDDAYCPLDEWRLIAWWLNQDELVANLKGHWRGPVAESAESGTR